MKLRSMVAWAALAVSPLAAAEPLGQVAAPVYEPPIAAASKEAETALRSIQPVAGVTASLFAAEPELANPVAICFDPQGRLFVAETFRQDNNRGAEDNRKHLEWLDDDLAAQTVEDREAYIRKHVGDVTSYTEHHDRIRLLEDRDGDGRADSATVFADGFNQIVEGTGAGVLFDRGNLLYTCIPNLWQLRDEDGDGKADSRKSLHYGYGVRTAFRAHDLHGLTLGPDGRIYFSIGDRGYNIKHEDRTISDPECGAVFRCNRDGSNLEVFATGLRNPQELAFDEFGNLFTVDNNSDYGDKARLVHVIEGGDSGWRMAFQYLPDRGPWGRERLWEPQHEGQPAYIIPPIANMANGPSGLVYYPGVGLADRYNGHFFLAEFRGAAATSGVISFAVKPKGAGFELVDEHMFISSLLATDVEFGADGDFYVADWVHGWLGEHKGRIYRFHDAEAAKNPAVAEAKQLFAEGMSKRPIGELKKLLAHPNMRVRLNAQFELAERGEEGREALTEVLEPGNDARARRHAVWGLAQLSRTRNANITKIQTTFSKAVTDDDPQVRAQIARCGGDATINLTRLLKDENPQVQALAAISVGKTLAAIEARQALFDMLESNDDQDPTLRHAAVMGLSGRDWGPGRSLIGAAKDRSPAVRRGVLLALRRLGSPRIEEYLKDADLTIVEEAARAIHDVPIAEALPELAAVAERSELNSDPLLRRVLNANFRLGEAKHAKAVAAIASRESAPEALRVEAVRMLGDWANPSPKDRVLNMWRPLKPRPEEISTEALREVLPMLVSAPEAVRSEATTVAAKLGIREVGPALLAALADAKRPAAARVAALTALAQLDGLDAKLDGAVKQAITDDEPAVRAAGRRILSQRDPATAIEPLREAIEKGAIVEQQQALADLAAIRDPKIEPIVIDTILGDWLDRLIAGKVADECKLDVLAAAGARSDESLKEKVAAYEAAKPKDAALAAYAEALAGGSAERGELVFFQRAQVYCVRCHTVGGRGGLVGPDLSKIGSEKKREYLLEAIIAPDRAIAKGFETVVLQLDDGRTVAGMVKAETETHLKLMTAEAKLLEIEKETIEDQTTGKSAMPGDVAKHLSKWDVRDLVEFLARQGITQGTSK